MTLENFIKRNILSKGQSVTLLDEDRPMSQPLGRFITFFIPTLKKSELKLLNEYKNWEVAYVVNDLAGYGNEKSDVFIKIKHPDKFIGNQIANDSVEVLHKNLIDDGYVRVSNYKKNLCYEKSEGILLTVRTDYLNSFEITNTKDLDLYEHRPTVIAYNNKKNDLEAKRNECERDIAEAKTKVFAIEKEIETICKSIYDSGRDLSVAEEKKVKALEKEIHKNSRIINKAMGKLADIKKDYDELIKPLTFEERIAKQGGMNLEENDELYQPEAVLQCLDKIIEAVYQNEWYAFTPSSIVKRYGLTFVCGILTINDRHTVALYLAKDIKKTWRVLDDDNSSDE